MTQTPQPGVLPWIVSQHAEEAAFQWLLRDDAVKAPHYLLGELASLDDTVDAHLDGLFIAGNAGWEQCQAELDWAEPGELFAAAVLAYQSGNAEHVKTVTDAAVASLDAAPGLASALGWLPYDVVKSYVVDLLIGDEPALQALGFRATALHRRDPGESLVRALGQFDPLVTPQALRAAGELGRQDLLPMCQNFIDSDSAETAFWAAWATVLLGDKSAAEKLVNVALQGGVYAEQACAFGVRAMDRERAANWVQELKANASQKRLAIIAAGASGDPRQVAWLIETMTDDEHARIAGESFGFIVGVDLALADLERDRPEDFESGPNEDPTDDDVDLDPDEDLMWPSAELIATWWEENRSQFDSDRRYLAGRICERDSYEEVLRDRWQRQRAAAALELVLLEPGQPLFEVTARGNRQITQLNKGR